MFAFHLVKDFVFAERQDRDEGSASLDGEFDEPHAMFQGEIEGPRVSMKGFRSSTNDDGNGPVVAKHVLARFPRDRAHPERQDVVAVKREHEIGLQGHQAGFDPGELTPKVSPFGRKRQHSAVR